MKKPTKGTSTKRSTGKSRSNSREEDQHERSMGSRGSRRESGVGAERYGRNEQGFSHAGQRAGNYGREGVRTISGRYSDFEDYSGSPRNRQDRDESDRGFARGGRRGEYSSTHDQDFYEGSSGRNPWRETYDADRNDSYRGSSRSQNYGGQDRGSFESEFNDDSRMNSRASRYGSSRGYNESSDYDRDNSERRYGSGRERYSDRDENFMNNYDNQDESMEDEYGYRERYNENRY